MLEQLQLNLTEESFDFVPTQLTEIFVNDVLFYTDASNNSWFDVHLNPIDNPTI